MSWEERIPPLRAALIQPVDRNETYSASALYAGALVRELLPGARAASRRTAGGSAWGRASARSRCCTRTSATRRRSTALLLQSGSFFRQRSDKQESRLPALPAHHALRRHGAARRGRRAPIPIAITCGTAEENRANNRAIAAGARRAGLPGVARRGARRAQLDVLARRASTRTCPRCSRRVAMNRRAIEIDGGTVLAYGHYGRPVLAFPSENGEVVGLGGPRHGRRARGRCSTPGRLKLYCVAVVRPRELDARATCRSRSARGGTATTSGGCSTRLVPFVQADSHTRGRCSRPAARFGAYHAANFCLKRADLFPLAICMSGVYDVVGAGRRRARRRRLLQQPDGLRRAPARRPPRLAARAARRCCSSAARASGRTRPARSSRRRRFGGAARREGHPARARPLGPRRAARLAVVAAADRASSASLLS